MASQADGLFHQSDTEIREILHFFTKKGSTRIFLGGSTRRILLHSGFRISVQRGVMDILECFIPARSRERRQNASCQQNKAVVQKDHNYWKLEIFGDFVKNAKISVLPAQPALVLKFNYQSHLTPHIPQNTKHSYKSFNKNFLKMDFVKDNWYINHIQGKSWKNGPFKFYS